MTAVAIGLLDTSIFIARESGRPLDVARLPERGVICPVTVAELQAGVLIARDVDTRARRLATLDATADIEVLPIDASAAAEWARLRVRLAESSRSVNVNDLWIADDHRDVARLRQASLSDVSAAKQVLVRRLRRVRVLAKMLIVSA